jgi:hypothetical protein
MRDQGELEKVKSILSVFSELAPGHAVELRIPPYAAIQCVDGPKHTRGTPPNVVEMKAETLFSLINGSASWDASVESGAIHASGERSDLSELFLQVMNRINA